MKLPSDNRTDSVMLPVKVSETHFNLVILISPKSAQRMQRNDPAAIIFKDLPAPYCSMQLDRIVTCMPSEEDMKTIHGLYLVLTSQEEQRIDKIADLLHTKYNLYAKQIGARTTFDVKGLIRNPSK